MIIEVRKNVLELDNWLIKHKFRERIYANNLKMDEYATSCIITDDMFAVEYFFSDDLPKEILVEILLSFDAKLC